MRERPNIPPAALINTAADLVIGVSAGLAAALIMSLFQSAVTRMGLQSQPRKTAAMKAADAISQEVAGASLKPRYKQKADLLLHYLTGAAAGGIYGLFGRLVPALRAGQGLLYGGLVWAMADEGLVPALGLSAPANRKGLGEHGFALSSHLVYGAALDIVRRRMNRMVAGGRVNGDPSEGD